MTPTTAARHPTFGRPPVSAHDAGDDDVDLDAEVDDADSEDVDDDPQAGLAKSHAHPVQAEPKREKCRLNIHLPVTMVAQLRHLAVNRSVSSGMHVSTGKLVQAAVSQYLLALPKDR